MGEQEGGKGEIACKSKVRSITSESYRKLMFYVRLIEL